MAIAQQVAGYSLGAADLLRRAMGKKKKEILDKEYVPFSAGMRERGYSDEAIKTLWDILVPFSDYAFNKAHTAGYGLVSYWTGVPQGQLPGRVHGRAAHLRRRRQGQVGRLPGRVPPDGHQGAAAGRQRRPMPVSPRSATDIRFGLAAVRNVGANVVESIVRVPQGQGPLHRLLRLPPQGRGGRLQQADGRVADQGRRVRLARPHPAGLLAVHADAIDSYLEVKRNEAIGQFDLFGDAFGDPAAEAAHRDADHLRQRVGQPDLLSFEREMLGLYVSAHPLPGLERVLRRAADTSIAALAEEGTVADGQVVTLAGILSGVQRRITKQGKAWASATLEDLDGGVEVLFFPNTYELVGQYIAEDAIVVVKGRVDRRDDQARIMAMDMALPDITAADATKPVVLALAPSRCTPPLVERLREVLTRHPGSSEVHLKLVNGSRSTLLRLGPMRVSSTPALMADLKALLGPSALAG